MNIPLNIQKLIKNLREQDNLATHLPQYIVQTKERIYYCDDGSGDYVWVDEDFNEADDDKQKELDEQDECQLSEENVDEGWHKVYYKDIWYSKQPFFTHVAAQEYIDGNKHNMNEPRIWVESGYRNAEWEMIRDYFLTLGAKEED
jgi:hypothetical protein